MDHYKRYSLLVAFVMLSVFAFGQRADSVYQKPDVMPVYIGGDDSLQSFFTRNMKWFGDNDIQGRTVIECTINKDGSLRDIRVYRGVSSFCDKEVVRVAKMLRFKPGLKGGKPVRVKYYFSVMGYSC